MSQVPTLPETESLRDAREALSNARDSLASLIALGRVCHGVARAAVDGKSPLSPIVDFDTLAELATVTQQLAEEAHDYVAHRLADLEKAA